MSFRLTPTLGLLLGLLIATATMADTGTSAGDAGGEGGGPFAGLLQAPEANLFTGGLSQSIAIRIPPGRKMATPNLNLVYSSSGGGNGLYGEGWSLPLGAIERSTKWGVPLCTGSASDEFVLSLNGSAVELVNFGPGGGGTVYRPRTDQSFLEAIRKPDNSWEVFERSGMRYQFGKTAESRRERSPTCTTVWGLTQIEDPNDNTVEFTYLTGKQTLLVDTIAYGGDPGSQAFEVSFEYQPHPIPTTSWRNGTKEVVADLVSRIHVAVNAGSYAPRIYDLKYDDDYVDPEDPPAGCDAPDRVLLCEVSVNDGMPTQRFEYAPEEIVLGATSGGTGLPVNHLRSATVNADVKDSVMDMNGDGRIDFVNASNSSQKAYTVYWGRFNGGVESAASLWCADSGPTGTIEYAKLRRETDFENGYAWTQKETVDLTGDGLPDFVDAMASPWLVYPGSLGVACPTLGTIPGFVPTPLSWTAPAAYSTLTEREHENQVGDWVRTWKRLVDMNADGRADLVVAHEAPGVNWTVYLNTGSGFVAQGAFANSAGPISSELKLDGDPYRRTLRDLFDFNGDGLPDRVEGGLGVGGSGPFLVYLNNGAGFDAAISIATTGDSAVRVVKSPNGETEADFIDLNGDGLVDRVRISASGGDWRVRLNRGTFALGEELSAEQSWGALGPIRENNSKGNTKIDMLDWNHDGLVDRVDAKTGGGVLHSGLASGPTLRPYLMTASYNGIGGSFVPTYQPSTRFQNTLLPFVSWVVTATRRTDGLCSGSSAACLDSGNEIQRTYTYANGYFDGPTREFRGFGLVTESFPWASNATLIGRRRVHFNQDEHTRGQIDLEETQVNVFGFPSGSFVTALRNTYTWETSPDGPRTQVWLAEKKSEVLDVETGGGEHQCRLDRNEEPDVYGRVDTRCSLPCGTSNPGSCSDAVAGKVTTLSVWADPSNPAVGDPLVRERPASVAVSYTKPGGGVEPLSEQTFSYAWPQGNVLTATTTGDATTGGNATVTTGYGDYGNMTSVTDAEGGVSTSAYSGTPFELFPSSESNAAGHTVQTQWDLRHGKEIQVIGPNGAGSGDVTEASYDAAGRVTCEAKPGSSCTGTSPVPSATYSYVYGDPGAPTWEGKLSYVQMQTREPSNASGPLPGYLLTRSYFDALGRQRATATWRVVGGGNTLVWVVTKQIDYLGLGQAKRVYAPYPGSGAGTGAVGLLQTPTSAFTEYEYNNIGVGDPTGRVRAVTAPDGTVTRTEYGGAWTHVYDAENNKTSTKSDFLGREVQRKLYTLSTTLEMQYDYTYDGLDRLLTTTVGGATVTNTWDRLGRKRQLDDPDSGTWHTRFDLNGNTLLQDDPKTGQRIEACYDDANRVVLQCSYPSDGVSPTSICDPTPPAQPACGSGGTEIARYFYDIDPDAGQECGGPGAVGQLTSAVDTSGGECWAYDARGRVTTQKKTILHNATSTTAKMDFGYDDADHLLWVRYPEQTVGHDDYTYQADGLPDTLEYFVAATDYDLFGRITKITSYRNTEDIYTYDTTGTDDNFRLQAIQTKQFSTGTVYLNLTQSYTDRGKLKQVGDSRDAGTPRSNAASYCYDGIGRLLGVDRDPSGQGTPCAGNADETFAHDNKGNLIAKNGAAFGFGANPHQPTTFGSVYSSIGYDANGSRTLKDKGAGNKDELVYDARGLLVQVKRWTSGSITSSQTNLYDYAGTRVVKAPSSGAGTTIRSYSRYADVGGSYLTKYYYFGGRMIGTYTVAAPSHLVAGDRDPDLVVPPARIELPPQLLFPAAGAVLLLLFLPLGRRRALGVRVGLARAASLSLIFVGASAPVVLFAGCGADPAVRVYHVDHLGSTQVVTDWNGNIYRQIRYTAYGEIRGRFNAAGNPAGFAEDARYEFTGYETDFAGLDYAGARFFDPELAQFGTHDPAGQYPSPYAYGPGDPVNGTDPSGALFGIDDAIIAIAVQVIIEVAKDIAITAAVGAVAAFVDTYAQTGSARAGVSAAGHAAADGATFGIYGQVKAISNDEIGHYMASYFADLLTGGIYGTVRSIEDGQYAGAAVSLYGVLGRVSDGLRAYSSSRTVSGSEILLADSGPAVMTDQAALEYQHLGALAQEAALAERVVNGVIDVLSTVLVVGDVLLGGPTGEGIIPAMGIQVFRLGGKQAAKQAAKEAFRKEARDLPKRVIRDARHGGTGRIKGVGAGRATYRPKPDGSYSVTPQSGRASDTLHFLP